MEEKKYAKDGELDLDHTVEIDEEQEEFYAEPEFIDSGCSTCGSFC